MAASQVAVETGGKSCPRLRISVPAVVSGMAPSCTTSIRYPNAAVSVVLGCTKNTVVPREPLRGAGSMILKPFSFM